MKRAAPTSSPHSQKYRSSTQTQDKEKGPQGPFSYLIDPN